MKYIRNIQYIHILYIQYTQNVRILYDKPTANYHTKWGKVKGIFSKI